MTGDLWAWYIGALISRYGPDIAYELAAQLIDDVKHKRTAPDKAREYHLREVLSDIDWSGCPDNQGAQDEEEPVSPVRDRSRDLARRGGCAGVPARPEAVEVNALTPFDYSGQQVRVVAGEDGEPWFVAADLLAILDLNRSSVALLDDDERGVHTMDTPSGQQQMSVISEAGLYSLILRSRKPEAKAFKRWVTHEVLPTIRKTGQYGTVNPAAITRADLARMVLEAETAREAAETRAAELEAPATAWNQLASTANGDLSVNEAAKTLSRDHKIVIGERRLWTLLREWRWLYRDAAGDWRPYQAHVDNGRLATRARSHHHPRTGELVLDAPQVRVTAKGLGDIHARLARGAA